MKEYFTLNELWQKNGFQSIKVGSKLYPFTHWFMAMGKAPDGTFYGYDESGKSCWERDECTFFLYLEPEPVQPKLIAWTYKEVYEPITGLYRTYYSFPDYVRSDERLVRAPWLDQENLEKLLEKKK